MRALLDPRRLAARDPDLEGLRVLVVGLGRSGLAAARLAISKGARVTINDRKSESELGQAADETRSMGAALCAGAHSPALADSADLLVVSPGVPPNLELLEGARRSNVPIWGEVELAARYCKGRVIAITGSNGKSTVTAMVGTILRGAKIGGGTGGNLATPFCELLAEDSKDAVHALELSSFQLETLSSLDPAVAVMVNLSPDHLDRYASFEDYARAKARLLELQSAEDHAILNADDPESARFLDACRAEVSWFSTRRDVERGAVLAGGWLSLRSGESSEAILEAADLPVPGEHNVANALAAALATRRIGCAPAAIAAGLRAFRALPHRLERVAAVRDVTFYNDSKGTNPASTARALASFPPGRVQLILGGRDKGANWTELLELVRERARRVLLVGEAAGELGRRLSGSVPACDCGTIAKAVEEAWRGARPGDVVLLSPACASYDQYRNFEERGEDFRRRVLELGQQEGEDA